MTRGRHRPVKTDLTYTLPLVETWYACSQRYTPPSTWQRLRSALTPARNRLG